MGHALKARIGASERRVIWLQRKGALRTVGPSLLPLCPLLRERLPLITQGRQNQRGAFT